MRYMKKFKDSYLWFEVSFVEAVRTLLGSYKDTPDTRNLLENEGEIPCLFSVIRVSKDKGFTETGFKYLDGVYVQSRCRDCAYLMEDDDKDWYCDNCGMKCCYVIDNCPLEGK